MNTNTEPDILTFKKPDGKEGISLSINVENGHILLDFGQPTQRLGATADEIKYLIFMLGHAVMHAENSAVIPAKGMN
jgi:hypothetical protein